MNLTPTVFCTNLRNNFIIGTSTAIFLPLIKTTFKNPVIVISQFCKKVDVIPYASGLQKYCFTKRNNSECELGPYQAQPQTPISRSNNILYLFSLDVTGRNTHTLVYNAKQMSARRSQLRHSFIVCLRDSNVKNVGWWEHM
jgi:hypothetical protein